MTYVPLAQITLAAPDSDVTFANIPNSFRDLVLVVSAKATQENNRGFRLRFNGDGGANYRWVWAFAYPSSQTSVVDNAATSLPDITTPGSNTSDFATIRVNIMDYAVTDKHKSTLGRTDFIGADARVMMSAGRWANTNAITSISCNSDTNTFAIGSTFTLFGIAG